MAEAQQRSGERPKVFISYSRADGSALAEELVPGLQLAGFEPYLDEHDVEKAVDYEERLGALILKADTVVFIITPEAVRSRYCQWEVDRSVELGKRLIPVQWIKVADAEVPERLRRLNYTIFSAGQSVTRPLAELATALRQDIEWIRAHTLLGEQAARWKARGETGHADDLLIRGSELAEARDWPARRRKDAPEITDLQRAFLSASEAAEEARTSREREQLETMRRAQAATARSQKRAAWLLGGVGVLLLAGTGYLVWEGYDVARREMRVYTSLASNALRDGHFDRATRYALQAYPARGSLPWLTPFSTELEGKLAGAALSTRLQHALSGHSRRVLSASFSPDGKRVLTASDDRTARLWDAETGRETAVLKAHSGNVNDAAFSPDGRRVVTTSYDGTARVWDVEAGREVMVLKGHRGIVNSPAFSPDGKRVVTGSWDRTARVWDVETGNPVAALRGHTDIVRRVAFSRDGERVVTASADGTARLWNAEAGTQLAVLKGHRLDIVDAAFSPDGKRVVTGSWDRTARLWDAETGRETAVLKAHSDGVHDAAFSSDGRRVVTASYDETARVWDVETQKEIAVLRGHAGYVKSAAFSPDGKRVVTGSADRTARLWDAETGNEIAVLRAHTGELWRVAFSPDGKRVVTSSSDLTARLWDVESGKDIAVLPGHTSWVTSASFSPDGRRVLTAAQDWTARIWDVSWVTHVRGEELRERVCAEKLVGAAQEFSPAELEDPILRVIDVGDPIARNPCLRRGPLSLDYWARLPGKLWRSARRLAGVK